MPSRSEPDTQRAWPIRSAPKTQLCYLLIIEMAVLVWAVFEVAAITPREQQWVQAGMLVVLAIVFEEASKRAARLRLRIGSELRQDMTSVWALAAAVALPGGLAACVVVAVLTFVWFRQERPSGAPLFAMLFNTAQFVASCLCASLVTHAITNNLQRIAPGLVITVAIAGAVTVFAIVNRLLVTGGLIAAHLRGRALLGSTNENLIEFATLCLGGIVAAVLVHEPWLCALAIAPLFALQRGALVSDLETAAATDPKTGLFNAVSWEHIAQRELSRALRTDASLAVLIIDIDRFKLVNDQYGHLVGDHVLREVGRSLAAGVREYDTVGRFGGEEFVAVLPDASDADALVIAERLRARINAVRIRDLVEGVDPANEAVMSVSVGVAGLHDPDVELPDLLRGADVALYRAKASGRNRVVLAEPGVDSAVGRVDARLPLT